MKLFIIVSFLITSNVFANRDSEPEMTSGKKYEIIKRPSVSCKSFLNKIKAGKSLRPYKIKVSRIGGNFKLSVNTKLSKIKKIRLAKTFKANGCRWEESDMEFDGYIRK